MIYRAYQPCLFEDDTENKTIGKISNYTRMFVCETQMQSNRNGLKVF